MKIIVFERNSDAYVRAHTRTHVCMHAQIKPIKAVYAVWWMGGSHCLLGQLGGAAHIRISWIPVNSFFDVPEVDTQQFYILWNEKSHVLIYCSHLFSQSLIFFYMNVTTDDHNPIQD